MSQENVEAFKRGVEAINRRDWDALLEILDPNVEWYPASLTPWAGGAAVSRGHEGVRQWFEDVGEVFPELRTEFPDIRDLGDRVVALGRNRTRGEASGAETTAPTAYIIEFEDRKAMRVWSYLDHQQALEAAGLSE
jgi:ketosteroid isomerase-like protein